MSATTSGAAVPPEFVCGPTTGCGKSTPMVRRGTLWETPPACAHCGKAWAPPIQLAAGNADVNYVSAWWAQFQQRPDFDRLMSSAWEAAHDEAERQYVEERRKRVTAEAERDTWREIARGHERRLDIAADDGGHAP